MGRPKGWASDQTGRPVLRPPVGRREHHVRFWAAIAAGATSVDAAALAGVSGVVGVRWFREAGGMPTVTQASLSGRYLTFAEREEIALSRATGCGVREIARQLSRSPSTISRELRRNAATRGGHLDYRASTAQWHADLRARRPKPAKLAVNSELRRYVQDRLSGVVERSDGIAVAGPEVRWVGRWRQSSPGARRRSGSVAPRGQRARRPSGHVCVRLRSEGGHVVTSSALTQDTEIAKRSFQRLTRAHNLSDDRAVGEGEDGQLAVRRRHAKPITPASAQQRPRRPWLPFSRSTSRERARHRTGRAPRRPRHVRQRPTPQDRRDRPSTREAPPGPRETRRAARARGCSRRA